MKLVMNRRNLHLIGVVIHADTLNTIEDKEKKVTMKKEKKLFTFFFFTSRWLSLEREKETGKEPSCSTRAFGSNTSPLDDATWMMMMMVVFGSSLCRRLVSIFYRLKLTKGILKEETR